MSKKYLDLDGMSHLKTKLDATYVAKVAGKNLSTNDYTNEEKTKLAGTESGAEKNVLSGIQVNGNTITPTNKIANIPVPTKVSQLQNDSGYLTQHQDISNKVDKEDGKGLSTNDYTNEEKTKLASLQNYTLPKASANNLGGIKIGDGLSIDSDGVVSADVSGEIPTKVSQLQNDSGYQTANDVSSAIDSKISSTYKAKGSIAFASLPSLIKANEGFVYNITNSFTTTSDFVEGAGKSYPAGTNVVIINTTGSTYKYDVLSSFVDLSGYVLNSDLVAISNAEIDALFA
ncbi:MAG: hypothetical protein MJ200_05325 [Mycoplasmoidaceae bacterium]|nr:hypothetical protein [Mycoplasmoidaceae bacterium]